jgi:hypothetical protein
LSLQVNIQAYFSPPGFAGREYIAGAGGLQSPTSSPLCGKTEPQHNTRN